MQPRKEGPKCKTSVQALKKSGKRSLNLGGISIKSVAKRRESSDLKCVLDFGPNNGWRIEKSRTDENESDTKNLLKINSRKELSIWCWEQNSEFESREKSGSRSDSVARVANRDGCRSCKLSDSKTTENRKEITVCSVKPESLLLRECHGFFKSQRAKGGLINEKSKDVVQRVLSTKWKNPRESLLETRLYPGKFTPISCEKEFYHRNLKSNHVLDTSPRISTDPHRCCRSTD